MISCSRAITAIFAVPDPYPVIMWMLACAAAGAIVMKLYMMLRWYLGMDWQRERERREKLLKRTQRRP